MGPEYSGIPRPGLHIASNNLNKLSRRQLYAFHALPILDAQDTIALVLTEHLPHLLQREL